MPISLHLAMPGDAGEIATMVNRAYRPEPGAGGWTHERELVAGVRTSVAQVAALIASAAEVLLLRQDGRIAACIEVTSRGTSASLGMLATDPVLQARGLGKRLLAEAELRAAARGAQCARLVVISAREALMAFYLRRGYVRTGQVEAFPLAAGAGVPVLPGLRVEVLEKQLGAPAGARS